MRSLALSVAGLASLIVPTDAFSITAVNNCGFAIPYTLDEQDGNPGGMLVPNGGKVTVTEDAAGDANPPGPEIGILLTHPDLEGSYRALARRASDGFAPTFNTIYYEFNHGTYSGDIADENGEPGPDPFPNAAKEYLITRSDARLARESPVLQDSHASAGGSASAILMVRTYRCI